MNVKAGKECNVQILLSLNDINRHGVEIQNYLYDLTQVTTESKNENQSFRKNIYRAINSAEASSDRLMDVLEKINQHIDEINKEHKENPDNE